MSCKPREIFTRNRKSDVTTCNIAVTPLLQTPKICGLPKCPQVKVNDVIFTHDQVIANLVGTDDCIVDPGPGTTAVCCDAGFVRIDSLGTTIATIIPGADWDRTQTQYAVGGFIENAGVANGARTDDYDRTFIIPVGSSFACNLQIVLTDDNDDVAVAHASISFVNVAGTISNIVSNLYSTVASASGDLTITSIDIDGTSSPFKFRLGFTIANSPTANASVAHVTIIEVKL